MTSKKSRAQFIREIENKKYILKDIVHSHSQRSSNSQTKKKKNY